MPEEPSSNLGPLCDQGGTFHIFSEEGVCMRCGHLDAAHRDFAAMDSYNAPACSECGRVHTGACGGNLIPLPDGSVAILSGIGGAPGVTVDLSYDESPEEDRGFAHSTFRSSAGLTGAVVVLHPGRRQMRIGVLLNGIETSLAFHPDDAVNFAEQLLVLGRKQLLERARETESEPSPTAWERLAEDDLPQP